jgi:tetraacyldisaccharide 4'-kinase
MSFKRRIASLHYAPGASLSPWLWPLLPLAWGYRLLVEFRLLAYRQGWLKRYVADVPVISVGNLTTGGTGKTPIVIEIARGLIRAGKTVVVLNRGYGAAEPVAYARALDPRHGDEAYLIQEQVPEAIVIVGRDRVQTVRKAIQDYRPDYVLLDDGFQYLRLHRDIDLLLIDGDTLLGNGHLLPVGPLREPQAQLRRADLVFITKTVTTEAMQSVESWVRAYGNQQRAAGVQVVPVGFQPVGVQGLNQKSPEPIDWLRGRDVIAFSGVARPERFEQDLEGLGARLIRHFRFEDHHVYTAEDIQAILGFRERCPDEPPALITTDKDLTKVRGLIPLAFQDAVCTLKMAPALDGQWFYHEFLTQMSGRIRAEGGHVQSSHR